MLVLKGVCCWAVGALENTQPDYSSMYIHGIGNTSNRLFATSYPGVVEFMPVLPSPRQSYNTSPFRYGLE